MQNNWYIIYTRSTWEKKVASSLKKRKIEVFLPLHYKQRTSFRRIKSTEQALFKNYVFAKIAENEIFKLKDVRGVINLVYWKGQPAKIKHHEIEILKDLVCEYDIITLEKTKVNVNQEARVVDNSRHSILGNVLTIKNTHTIINLPSLGVRLIAKAALTEPIITEDALGAKELLFQS